MAIIGIDLGTTNSSCAIWTDAGAKLIPNRLGLSLTPSVVGIGDDGDIIVGQIAKERLITHENKSVAAFKRLMGTNHQVKLGKQLFSATELSSIVLKALKEDAESFLGETVEEAIISVPAYFNDNQRNAVKLAGELVGLKVERLINEPTSAAIAYGLHNKEEGTFIILDMGGGTFDVSILEYFEGVMEVHASAGDNHLGGEDFVEIMVDSVLAEAQVDKSSISSAQMQKVIMQMETCKRRMGQKKTQDIELQLGKTTFSWQLTDEWFSRICTPLLLRAQRPIERAINDAKISINEIDDIVLVGGATRMGVFRNSVGRLFKRLPSCHLDPDLVVATGAAIQAGLKSKDEALDDMVLTDVCPYTLGTEVNNPSGGNGGGYFLPIIERNSVVPTSIVRTLQTASDDQTKIELRVFQGEHRMVEKNVFLGSMTINVPKGPEGKEMIDVRYSYDMNGLLEVDVKVLSTGKTVHQLIENTPGSLTQKEIAESTKKLAGLKFHPREHEKNRALIARGERVYESVLGDVRDYIASVMADFEKLLDQQNLKEIEKAQVKFEEILVQFDTQEWH